MAPERINWKLCVAMMTALLSSQASAQNSLFLANGALAHVTKADIAIARPAIRAALDSGDDGYTYTWSNPATGASGTVTPMKAYKKISMECRRADVTAYAGGVRGGSAWEFCKVGADWKRASR